MEISVMFTDFSSDSSSDENSPVGRWAAAALVLRFVIAGIAVDFRVIVEKRSGKHGTILVGRAWARVHCRLQTLA